MRVRDPLVQISAGLWMMARTWGCNVYIVGEGRPSFIDAGFPLDTRSIGRMLRSRDPAGPEYLVATHYHLDHMGSMSRLKKQFSCHVVAHQDDADIMEGTAPYPTFKLDPLRAFYYKVLGPLYPYECVKVDRRLTDGDVIDLMGGLTVVHTPGHTAGSMMLFQPDRRMLFTSDTIRNEDGVLDGPPPQYTPDMESAFESIEEKVMALDFDILLPGHGDVILSGAREAVGRMLQERKVAR
jgi:glyoxylase-like metal-dependent hydrolase (beta-lactamase superfamily II)